MTFKRLNCLFFSGLLLMATGSLSAQEEALCLDCHTDDADSPVHAIFRTPHGAIGGGGNAVCTACHGASRSHQDDPDETAPDVSFGPHWPADPAARSASCQSCHNKGDQLFWAGSQHQQENLACDSCHTAHAQKDLADKGKEEICLSCHAKVRSEIHLPSRHPIAEGKTTCIDCHNPHGGLGEAALREVTLNDTCFGCHADKRGPFLWEHPPAAEDCALCHRPHGSVNDDLLTTRVPALCQQCHVAAFHPSVPYGSEGLPGGSASRYQLGKGCLNCHSQIHGSNHPSGARLTR